MNKNKHNLPDGKAKGTEIPMDHLADPAKYFEGSLPDHAELFSRLLEQIEPINFESIAFPQYEDLSREIERLEAAIKKPDGTLDNTKTAEKEQLKRLSEERSKLKITQKHLLVISVEEIIKFAEQNNWGLCKNLGSVYLFNGAHWKNVNPEELQRFLGEAAEKMGVTKYSARFHKFRDELEKQFLSAAYLPAPKTDLDTVLINLQNGTLEITKGGTRLRGFDRNDFLKYQLPFKYDPEAKAPIFEKYLNRVLPDIERQRVLAEYLGYTFIRNGSNHFKAEKALMLYGGGANGKSVYFHVVEALLGRENISSYSLQDLTDERGYHRAEITDKLVNYSSEIGTKLKTELFKKLTSGEPITARSPYKRPFETNQYAKLIFNTNELPRDVEHTNAYFRRFLIIPFDVTIPEHERDRNLHNKIIASELPGILNWALDGLSRVLEQQDFSKCDAAERALKEYKLTSDSVRLYIDEYQYEKCNENTMPLKILYKDYRDFCIDYGYKPCSNRTFAGRLRGIGFDDTRHKSGIFFYCKNGSDPF